MKKNFQLIFKRAQKRGRIRFAVAGAESDEVLLAVHKAGKMGLMEPVLIGSAASIRRAAKRLRLSFTGIEILDSGEDSEMANLAAGLVAGGGVDAIMKGNISTPVLLKAVLDPEYGLRGVRLLSHIAYMDVPSFSKMFIITDSGMVVRPTLEQKVEIIQNAVAFIRRLGVRRPRIAVLAANEKVSPHMPETLDAVELVKMSERGIFGKVILEGPMALDMAFSRESVKIKGVRSRVAGSPDILLVPDIASGNIFAKGLVYLAGAKISGLIVGAKIPIVLISRAEKCETWLRSIALANLASNLTESECG
jgi:phosphate butyryltransferase